MFVLRRRLIRLKPWDPIQTRPLRPEFPRFYGQSPTAPPLISGAHYHIRSFQRHRHGTALLPRSQIPKPARLQGDADNRLRQMLRFPGPGDQRRD